MVVKPAPGKKIRCPITKEYIPDDGYKVSDDDLYWARRLRVNDVVKVTVDKEKPVESGNDGSKKA